MKFALCSWPTIFFSASQAENLGQSFQVWPFSLQKKHFTFDVSVVPSFGLSLALLSFVFLSPLSLPFSLPLPLPLLLPLPFMSASTSIGVVSFPSAMPHCLYAWCIAFHSLLRASYPCSLVAFRPTCLRHSGSCGLCAKYCCLDRVLKRVGTLCLTLSHKSFPLLQGLTSVSHKRKLQQLHQHRSVPSAVCWLPFFQKTSPNFESIRWIACFEKTENQKGKRFFFWKTKRIKIFFFRWCTAILCFVYMFFFNEKLHNNANKNNFEREGQTDTRRHTQTDTHTDTVLQDGSIWPPILPHPPPWFSHVFDILKQVHRLSVLGTDTPRQTRTQMDTWKNKLNTPQTENLKNYAKQSNVTKPFRPTFKIVQKRVETTKKQLTGFMFFQAVSTVARSSRIHLLTSMFLFFVFSSFFSQSKHI